MFGFGNKESSLRRSKLNEGKLSIVDLMDITTLPKSVAMEKYKELSEKGYDEETAVTYLIALDELFLGVIGRKEAVTVMTRILGTEQDAAMMLRRSGYT